MDHPIYITIYITGGMGERMGERKSNPIYINDLYYMEEWVNQQTDLIRSDRYCTYCTYCTYHHNNNNNNRQQVQFVQYLFIINKHTQ